MLCNKCKKDKSVSEFRKNKNFTKRNGFSYQCKSCDLMEKRTIEGQVMTMYHAASYNSKKRPHGQPTFTRDELLTWCKGNKNYLSIYKKWKDSGYTERLSPSIDRKDTSKGYNFDNIEIITWDDNHRRNSDAMSKPVEKLKDGVVVKRYTSVREAARDHNPKSTGSGILAALRDDKRTAYGHNWREAATASLEGRKLKSIRDNRVFSMPVINQTDGTLVGEEFKSLQGLLETKTITSSKFSSDELNDLILNHRNTKFNAVLLNHFQVWKGLQQYVADFIQLKSNIIAVCKRIRGKSQVKDFDDIYRDLRSIKMPSFRGGYEFTSGVLYGTETVEVLCSKTADTIRKGGMHLSIRGKTNVSKRKSTRNKVTSSKIVTDVHTLTAKQLGLAFKYSGTMQLSKIKKLKHELPLEVIHRHLTETLRHLLSITKKANNKGRFTTVYHAIEGLLTTTRMLREEEPEPLRLYKSRLVEYIKVHVSKMS